MLTLIYTSGTTGPPKGVELTHANMLAEMRRARRAAPDVSPDDRIISYLPDAHIADRWARALRNMRSASRSPRVADPRQRSRALPDVRPTVFGAVPAVW